MLSHAGVSLVLLSIWAIAYFVLKKKLITSRAYFFLLFLMGLAGLVLPLEQWLDIGTENDFSFGISILFALLLVGSLIPWLKFDNCFSKVQSIRFNPAAESNIRIVLIAMILMGIYAVLYTLPYAVIAYRMGAGEVRAFILDDSILPESPLTTVAVGVGFLAPVYILLFYMCLCSEKLKGFALPLFFASLTYLVTSAAAQARDGYIMIPLTYFFLYQVFKGFLPESSKKTIKRLVRISLPVLFILLAVITLDRFYNASEANPWQRVVEGTWGYFYQQPYVFDQTVQHQQFFHGVGNRFPLVGHIFGIPSTGRHLDFKFEYMFGTMYATFYSATGWGSLIIATLFFYISWTVVASMLNKQRNYFGMLIVHSIYLYFLISGLFYLRLSAENITVTYLIIITLSFFVKRYAIVEYKK